MTKAFEVNFDGLVGPTHNYSGLSFGNVASTTSQAQLSNPLDGVLQGLSKMKALHDMGLKQALLPPQERPDIRTLRRLGYSGSEAEVLSKVHRDSPETLAACSSASSMWTANAATIAPSADTLDGKVHFTPANLNSKFHRAIEPETTAAALKAIFRDPAHFAHHEPLPPGAYFGDEGAANHTRLCAEYGGKGLHFFVFGRYAFRPNETEPRKFPARQTYEASLAVARLHGLSDQQTVLWQQDPQAIDAGVFHNDVAGVGNRDVYFYHERSFVGGRKAVEALREKFRALTSGHELRTVEVPESAVGLPEAVKSYLFNSQLVTLPTGETALIAPTDCEEVPAVKRYIESLTADSSSPIRKVFFHNVKQSMRNGGGPACLRLRVVLSETELKRANQAVFMSDALLATLTSWAKKHYRDRLAPADLADPKLLNECRTALDELTQILKLGSIYPFQLTGA